MSDLAIRVSGVSKCYQVYEQPQDRLKQSILPRIKRLFSGEHSRYYREFWALNEVSFEVPKGGTVGIVGRNGSGKSTLLQIICGTLTPSSGRVETQGRIAALLELGSGFNPDFTGRENIYLYGAVLGLSRSQVEERFADIAAFADIGDFIDQPIKTYSSGMTVRLAFAVIAHVDADILIIDEALAVGDVVFTQKCMRFLRQFMRRGTVLFVSHDTASVLNLCQTAVWLDAGTMRMHGEAKPTVEAYLRECAQVVAGDAATYEPLKKSKTANAAALLPAQAQPTDIDTSLAFFDNISNADGWTTHAAEISSVELVSTDGPQSPVYAGGERVMLTIRAVAKSAIQSPIIGFFLRDRLGQALFGEHTYYHSSWHGQVGAGETVEARFVFSLPRLPNGDYSMTVSIAEGTPEDHVQHHWLHDAVLLKVSSPKNRFGLVGIPFEHVDLSVAERAGASG